MDHTRLKGVSEIGEAQLSEQLEANLQMWLQWGFLGIGAFSNVRIPGSGAYGGDFHRLRPVSDPYYDDGQVWQATRTDWVWESGIEYTTQPIRVSGVFVDGAFQPATGVGPYAHRVDYPRGRVVFDSAVAASKSVTCEYTTRYVQFHRADAPWWRQVQLDTYRPDDPHYVGGSGAYSILSENRIQLPAVVIDASPRTGGVPLQLGGGWIVQQDVFFTVLAQSPADCKKVSDVLTAQRGKRINLFNKNWVSDASAWPVDDYGSPVGSGRMYPDLVKPTGEAGFGWRQLRIEDWASAPGRFEPRSPVQSAVARAVCEVDMP